LATSFRVEANIPDVRLKQSARFPRGTVQVSVPDAFADWAAPGWVETPQAAPLAPSYEVTVDWRVSDGVIDETQALATAIMVALGSDRLADASDELPDNLDSNRRGWWGDMDAEIWKGWALGTRLWEMRRDAIRGSGYRFGATTVKAENFVREAMQPFVDVGIVSEFTVTVEQVTSERIDVLIVFSRSGAPAVNLRFAYLWDEIGKGVIARPPRLVPAPVPLQPDTMSVTAKKPPKKSPPSGPPGAMLSGEGRLLANASIPFAHASARLAGAAGLSAAATLRTSSTTSAILAGAGGLNANASVATVAPLLANGQAYTDLQRGMFLTWNFATYVGTEFLDASAWPIDTFNPTGLDITQWAQVASDFGCTYAVLTVKHQDGFTLWPTDTTTRGLVNTAWYTNNSERDITQEYVDAFRAAGILPFFYFSVLDTYWVYQNPGWTSAQYKAFAEAQITELLTRYGQIGAIWLDSTYPWFGNTWLPWASAEERNAFIRSVSPGIIIIDNNYLGSFASSDVLEYESAGPPGGNTNAAEMCFSIGGPYAWFWKADNEALASADSIASTIIFANANNCSSLVNVSPNAVGVIPAQFITRLDETFLLLGGGATLISPNNMTSNSAPAPFVASASSAYPGGYEAFNAFDSSATIWSSSVGALPEWIQIDLGSSQTVSNYSVQTRTGVAYHQWTAWTLDGSDNGSSWTTVDTRTDSAGAAGETRFYDLASPETYRYWRWTITNSNSGTYAECASIALYNA